MEYVTIKEQHLEDIGDAIRNLNKKATTTYRPKEMAAAINAVAADYPDIVPDNTEWVSVSDEYYASNGGIMYGIKGLEGFRSLNIANCSNLREIDLSEIVLHGGNSYGFMVTDLRNCPNLTSIKVHDNSSYFEQNNDAYYNTQGTLRLFDGKYEKFKVDNITLHVGTGLFCGCPKLKELTLPACSYIQSDDVFKNSFIEKIYFLGKPLGEKFNHIPTSYRKTYDGTWYDIKEFGYYVSNEYDEIDYPISPFAKTEHLTDIYVPWSKGEVLDEEGNDVLEEDRNLITRGVTVHYNWRY